MLESRWVAIALTTACIIRITASIYYWYVIFIENYSIKQYSFYIVQLHHWKEGAGISQYICAELKGTQALEAALLVQLLAPAVTEPSRANVAAVWKQTQHNQMGSAA